MATYAALQKQITQLQQQAQKLRDQEKGDVIGRIRQAIEAYGIAADELFAQPAGKQRKVASPKAKARVKPGVGVPKYQDPKTGKTWTGVGKPPAWIASARDRTKFLVEQPAMAAEKTEPTKARKASVTKAAKAGKSAATVKRPPTKRRQQAATEATAKKPARKRGRAATSKTTEAVESAVPANNDMAEEAAVAA